MDWTEDFRRQDPEKLATLFKAVRTYNRICQLYASSSDHCRHVGSSRAPNPLPLCEQLGNGCDCVSVHAEQAKARLQAGLHQQTARTSRFRSGEPTCQQRDVSQSYSEWHGRRAQGTSRSRRAFAPCASDVVESTRISCRCPFVYVSCMHHMFWNICHIICHFCHQTPHTKRVKTRRKTQCNYPPSSPCTLAFFPSLPVASRARIYLGNTRKLTRNPSCAIW